MSIALAGACEALGLRKKGDAITRLLAKRIIDHASDDIHDELPQAAALKGFRP